VHALRDLGFRRLGLISGFETDAQQPQETPPEIVSGSLPPTRWLWPLGHGRPVSPRWLTKGKCPRPRGDWSIRRQCRRGDRMDLSELEFRAESCRRVAAGLLDPDVVRELRALAERYEDLATRLRQVADLP
jgi:hypothetical protein